MDLLNSQWVIELVGSNLVRGSLSLGGCVRRPLYLVALILPFLLQALGCQKQPPETCVATEQAVLEVEHELWAAARSRDVGTLDKLTNDAFLSTDDGSVRRGRKELLADFKQPEGRIHNETDERPAILSFTKHWIDFDKEAGISFGATSVTTRVFTCKDGEWKSVAFHETDIPNKHRQPQASDHLGDYIGRYRLGENGDRGEISVARDGDKLFETWPGDKPTEILAGKYDTFFMRGDSWVARFVRDKTGSVSGILYTLQDGEIEAKRVR
jgi:hypothetical protein